MDKNTTKIRKILGLGNKDLGIVTITPDMAQELLAFNTNNRPRQMNYEREYAEDMLENKFHISESVIGFNDGVLTNGQTRLQACIASGREFETIVYLKLVQNIHMDTGKGRSDVDNIRLNKAVSEYIDDNASSIKTVKALIRTCKSKPRVRVEEIVQFCKDNSEAINKASEFGLLNLTGGKKYVFKVEIAAGFLAAAINGVAMEDLAHVREIITYGRSTDERDIVVLSFRDNIHTLCGNGGAASGSVRKQLYYGTQHAIYSYVNNTKAKVSKLDSEYYPIVA